MKKISRRTFVVQTAKAGTAAVAGLGLAPRLLAASQPATPPDISVVKGKDLFASTQHAVEQLGGISRFVSRGDQVGLLVNAWAKKPGTYTKPEIVLAVASLCYQAGAKQVYMLKSVDEDYFERSKIFEQHKALVSSLKTDDTDHELMKIPGAKKLEEARILKGAMTYERLINLPIIKNHSGVHMTCTLKNMMGISSTRTNLGFHVGPGFVGKLTSGWYNAFYNQEHFSQCVADLNLVRPVDLCVVDAHSFITTNGPSGPGKMNRPGEVVAGTDRVAIDALCARHLGLEAEEVGMIQRSHQNGLGEIDLTRRDVRRVNI